MSIINLETQEPTTIFGENVRESGGEEEPSACVCLRVWKTAESVYTSSVCGVRRGRKAKGDDKRSGHAFGESSTGNRRGMENREGGGVRGRGESDRE